MKKGLFVLAMLFLAINSYGQTINYSSNSKIITDSISTVSFRDLFNLTLKKASQTTDFSGVIYELTLLIQRLQSEKSDLDITIKEKNKFLGEALGARGVAKMLLEDYRGAISDFSEKISVVGLSDLITPTLSLRGDCKAQIGDYDGAILDFNLSLAMSKNPPNWELSIMYFRRGLAYKAKNQKEKACQDFSRAGELGNPDVYKIIKEFCN